jgi:hypothetical protein
MTFGYLLYAHMNISSRNMDHEGSNKVTMPASIKTRLTYQEGCEAPVNLDRAWCSEHWVVDVISDVQREQPVVGTVLEETGDGHRRMREPVHEQGFQKSFDIVQRPAAGCNAANNVHFSCCTDCMREI